MDPPGSRRPPAVPNTEGLDAASLELVLRALGAVGAVAAAEAAPAARAAAEQRAPVFNWNDDEEAAPRTAATHKDGERSASRGPCKCGFKHWLKGIEYDWVIPIPTTVGMLLLGYNKSEDPYDAAQRFIEEQKVKDSGLLDNSLVANLVEYILACTEAGDEPTYAGSGAAPVAATATPSAPAAQPAAPPTKEELEAREQARLKRERELRAEKDKAEAQKLEVKRQIELDKENRRREAEARRKADEERRTQAAQAPPLQSTSSSSSVVSQPSPPSSQPVSPSAPVQYSSTLQPVPRPPSSPWAIDSGDDDESGYGVDLSRYGLGGSGSFARPTPVPARGGLQQLSGIDHYARLKREEWTMEDVLQVYRTEGQMGLLTRLKKAGFSPDELIRLLQYAALMDSADRPLGVPSTLGTPSVKPTGSRSPEPQVFRGQGHSLRSSEPTSMPSFDSGAAKPAAPVAPAPPVASLEAVVVDPTQPKTMIKIRLHTGQQIVAHFNHTHTVLDIRRHIEITCPVPAGAVYELLLPPPGRTVLADHSVTIAKAGLQNATVIQSMRN